MGHGWHLLAWCKPHTTGCRHWKCTGKATWPKWFQTLWGFPPQLLPGKVDLQRAKTKTRYFWNEWEANVTYLSTVFPVMFRSEIIQKCWLTRPYSFRNRWTNTARWSNGCNGSFWIYAPTRTRTQQIIGENYINYAWKLWKKINWPKCDWKTP